VSRNWRPYVSPVYTRAAAPQLNVFAIAVPVKNATGRVVGILVLQIRIENLFQWVAGIDMGTDAFIYIVDSKGQLAFHSKHHDQKEIIDLSATPIVQKLRHGGQGVEIRNDAVDREEYVVAYSPVPEYGWGVIAQQPTRSSLSLQARDAELRQLLVGYGLILLLGAMTVILTLRIASARQRQEDDRRMQADLEQRVIERTTELQAANQELEAFSYSVSHDLRAPLRAIDGFSQALLEDYADRLDDQGKNYLNRVRAATQRMGLLIDDMLVLSQITRVEMRRETVDLSALAADVIAEFQRSEPERKVDWHIESGLVAEGDARLLRVVLVNLLGNAWKYTGKTATAKIEFGAMRNADGTTGFFVRDNGVGFDMAYASKLFGVFQRLHTLAEFPGTGVGLATVQRIIHRHGGQVRGEGVPGQGATFYFTLPG
jgi:signal transduction histidine kinase